LRGNARKTEYDLAAALARHCEAKLTTENAAENKTSDEPVWKASKS